jgi:hypothetical protein
MEDQPLKVQEELTLLTQALTSLQIEAVKCDEGNGAAGRRLRSWLDDLRKNMQALRFKIQEQKNQRRALKKAQSQQQ